MSQQLTQFEWDPEVEKAIHPTSDISASEEKLENQGPLICRDMPMPGILSRSPLYEQEYLELTLRFPEADPTKLSRIAKKMVTFMNKENVPPPKRQRASENENGGTERVRMPVTAILKLSIPTSTSDTTEL
jgi:hypothetical protein